MNFNSILIGSEDPQRLVDYYTKLFGEPGFSEGGYTGWQIGSGSVTIGPHSEVKGKSAHPGRIIWNIESDDVKGDFDAHGAQPAPSSIASRTRFEEAAGLSIATFADPDDNYFQLSSPFNARVLPRPAEKIHSNDLRSKIATVSGPSP